MKNNTSYHVILLDKSMDCFLHDNDPCHERVQGKKLKWFQNLHWKEMH